MCGFVEVFDERRHNSAPDPVFIDVEALKRCTDEVAAPIVMGVLVKQPGMVEELEHFGNKGRTDFELLVGLSEPVFGGLSLDADGVKSILDSFAWHRTVGGEVDKAFFLLVQPCEFLAVGDVERPGLTLCVRQPVVDCRLDDAEKLATQTEGCIVIRNGPLDLHDREMWQVALVVEAGGAFEVFIGPAVPARLGINQARFAASCRTPSAQEKAPEVVPVCSVAYLGL